MKTFGSGGGGTGIITYPDPPTRRFFFLFPRAETFGCRLKASRLRLRGILPTLPHHTVFAGLAKTLTVGVAFRVTSAPRDLGLAHLLALKEPHLLRDRHFGSGGGGTGIITYPDPPTRRFVQDFVSPFLNFFSAAAAKLGV
ncbi:hypothetical protein MTO96_029637 [Rhipicephalus appendiculatus]